MTPAVQAAWKNLASSTTVSSQWTVSTSSTGAYAITSGTGYTHAQQNQLYEKWMRGKVKMPKRHPSTRQVRCRGCARWAKELKHEGLGVKVYCKRCLGENPGFIPW